MGDERLDRLLPAVSHGGVVHRSGEIDEKRPGKARIGDAAADHHLDPDHQQLLPGEEPHRFEDPIEQSDQQRQEHEDNKGRQRKVPSTQRRWPAYRCC